MKKRAGDNGRAFVFSVLIGAFAGIAIQMLVTLSPEPFDPGELWALPVMFAAYGALAVPFVAIGLALFGVPAAQVLRGQAHKWWVGIVAVVWGAVTGKLVFFAIDHSLFLGQYEIAKVGPYDMGLIYGVPTALAWWLLHRREIVSD